MSQLDTTTPSGDYLMALDAGTGSVRAVIFDLNGNQIAAGQAGVAASAGTRCSGVDGV